MVFWRMKRSGILQNTAGLVETAVARRTVVIEGLIVLDHVDRVLAVRAADLHGAGGLLGAWEGQEGERLS